MFKKKKAQEENKMTYFFGGTVVGMAAGLLFRKLLSNSSEEHTRNPESEVYINENGNKYSQDDNIHNLHVKKSAASCRTRSKSASEYKEMNNSAERTIPLNKLDKDLKCNAANFNLNYKCDKNIPKYFYNNKDNTLYNISIEGNADYNLHSKISPEDCKDKKNDDNNEISKPEETEKEPEDNGSIKNDKLIKETNIQSTNDDDNNNNNKGTTQKQVKAEDHVELKNSFNSLSIDFCENFTSHINLQNVNDSRTINPNILLDYGDNLSNNATHNRSASLNNEEDTNRSNSSYGDEFHETDIISSTRQDNFEKV